MTSIQLLKLLSTFHLPVQDEKETQKAIEKIFSDNSVKYFSEHKFNDRNVVDFLVVPGIAVEVKIKGNARKIYKQCERYCQFDRVSELLLITNRSMGFPKEINGKPCYVLNIGRAWL